MFQIQRQVQIALFPPSFKGITARSKFALVESGNHFQGNYNRVGRDSDTACGNPFCPLVGTIESHNKAVVPVVFHIHNQGEGDSLDFKCAHP